MNVDLNNIINKYDLSNPDEKVECMMEACNEIAKHEDPIRTEYLIKQLAHDIGINESAIRTYVKRAARRIVSRQNFAFCPFTNGYCKGSDCRLFDDGCAFNRISFALLDIADNGISVRVENSKDIDTLCNSLSDIEVGISDIASVIQDK